MREPFVPIDETCVQHLVVENHHHYNPDRHDDVPIEQNARMQYNMRNLCDTESPQQIVRRFLLKHAAHGISCFTL